MHVYSTLVLQGQILVSFVIGTKILQSSKLPLKEIFCYIATWKCSWTKFLALGHHQYCQTCFRFNCVRPCQSCRASLFKGDSLSTPAGFSFLICSFQFASYLSLLPLQSPMPVGCWLYFIKILEILWWIESWCDLSFMCAGEGEVDPCVLTSKALHSTYLNVGDVVGMCLDLQSASVTFSLNGKVLDCHVEGFSTQHGVFFPVVSMDAGIEYVKSLVWVIDWFFSLIEVLLCVIEPVRSNSPASACTQWDSKQVEK